MPALSEQIALPEAFTADFTVVRALLQKGRGYEKAVSMFEPYSEVKDPDEATRDALREIVKQSLHTRRRAYVYLKLPPGRELPDDDRGRRNGGGDVGVAQMT